MWVLERWDRGTVLRLKSWSLLLLHYHSFTNKRFQCSSNVYWQGFKGVPVGDTFQCWHGRVDLTSRVMYFLVDVPDGESDLVELLFFITRVWHMFSFLLGLFSQDSWLYVLVQILTVSLFLSAVQSRLVIFFIFLVGLYSGGNFTNSLWTNHSWCIRKRCISWLLCKWTF